MVFIINLSGFTRKQIGQEYVCEFNGLWREHSKLIKNLDEVIHLFYMPEIHEQLVPILIEFVKNGNKDI